MTVKEAYKYIYSQLTDLRVHILLDDEAEDISQEECDEIIKFIREQHDECAC